MLFWRLKEESNFDSRDGSLLISGSLLSTPFPGAVLASAPEKVGRLILGHLRLVPAG